MNSPDTNQPRRDKTPPAAGGPMGRWIFLFALCLYVLTVAGEVRFGDGVAMLDVTESIVERGTLRIERDMSWFETEKGWSYFNSGLSVLTVPFYCVGKQLAGLCPPQAKWPVIELVSSLINPVLAALIAVIFFRLAWMIRPEKRSALAATLILVLATMLWYRSKVYLREPLSTLTLLLCVYWLARARVVSSKKPLLMAGGAFLLMIWTRFDLIILAPFFLVFILATRLGTMPEPRRVWKEAILSTVCFVLPTVLAFPSFLYFNSLKFGSPFNFGYPGLSLTGTPLGIGLTGLLVSPMHGLFVYSPPLIIGLAGLTRLFRRDRPLTLLITLMSAFLLVFYAKYSIWTGSFNIGPRFLLPIVPLLMLPAVMILDGKTLRGWGIAGVFFLTSWGFAVQALTVLGNWYVFFARYVKFFGKDGLFHTPARFLFSPLEAILQQVQLGDLYLIWLHLADKHLPSTFLLIPIAALAGLVFAVVRLCNIGRQADRSVRALWKLLPRVKRRRILLAGALVFALVLISAGQRAFCPRGLNLSLYHGTDTNIAPELILSGSLPLVDTYYDPFTLVTPRADLAVWEGYLRIPTNRPPTALHLGVDGRCLIQIADRNVFTVTKGRTGQVALLEKSLDLPQGYHPIRIILTSQNGNPFLTLRWTFGDARFRQIIGKSFLFPAYPGPVATFFLKTEFFFLALIVLGLLGLVAYVSEAFWPRSHEPKSMRPGD